MLSLMTQHSLAQLNDLVYNQPTSFDMFREVVLKLFLINCIAKFTE